MSDLHARPADAASPKTTAKGGTALRLRALPEQFGSPNYARVADAIRESIIAGEFEDGQRLNTLDLAHHYGLSLAPIREALHQLAAEGIVVPSPKRGATVRAVTAAFLAEIYEIRLGLIPYLDGERARIASPADITDLEEMAARYEAAVGRGSTAEVVRSNIELHRRMLAIRPNQEAIQILDRHHRLVQALRTRFGFSPSRPAQVIEEHRRLVEAFRRNDGLAAQELSRLHLRNSYEELVPLVVPGRGAR